MKNRGRSGTFLAQKHRLGLVARASKEQMISIGYVLFDIDLKCKECYQNTAKIIQILILEMKRQKLPRRVYFTTGTDLLGVFSFES